jgi:hypothetical protein
VGEDRADKRLGSLGINGPLEYHQLAEKELDAAILALTQIKAESKSGSKKAGTKK